MRSSGKRSSGGGDRKKFGGRSGESKSFKSKPRSGGYKSDRGGRKSEGDGESGEKRSYSPRSGSGGAPSRGRSYSSDRPRRDGDGEKSFRGRPERGSDSRGGSRDFKRPGRPAADGEARGERGGYSRGTGSRDFKRPGRPAADGEGRSERGGYSRGTGSRDFKRPGRPAADGEGRGERGGYSRGTGSRDFKRSPRTEGGEGRPERRSGGADRPTRSRSDGERSGYAGRSPRRDDNSRGGSGRDFSERGPRTRSGDDKGFGRREKSDEAKKPYEGKRGYGAKSRRAEENRPAKTRIEKGESGYGGRNFRSPEEEDFQISEEFFSEAPKRRSRINDDPSSEEGTEKAPRDFTARARRTSSGDGERRSAPRRDNKEGFAFGRKPKREDEEGSKPEREDDSERFNSKRPVDKKSGFDKKDKGGFEKKWNRKEDHAFYGEKKKKKAAPLSDAEGVRLNKFISNAGICSRREADELIIAGVISVNGKVVTEMGYRVQDGDEVKYNNETLRGERLKYVLLNKPKDFITTTDDPEDRKTVMSLVAKACRERIYPVGRLDRNTTGLLLFTNDGELATRLTHPSFNIHKVYSVELDRNIKAEDVKAIEEGLRLDDGMIKVDEIVVGPEKNQVGIEIHSGKNRIVRRIFEHLGYEVKKLDRVIFAGLTKKDLPRGRWRFLTDMELANLKMITGKKASSK